MGEKEFPVQPSPSLNPRFKKWHLLIWLSFVVIVFHYFKEVRGGGSAWKTADWLINYEGGAVRRGLLGQLAIYVSSIGVSLKWLVFFIQSAIYFGINCLVLKIYLMREREISWYALLLSPAFLLFPAYDLQGGFRKEIIVFLSFAIIAFSFANKKLGNKSILVGYFVYLVSVFSHELSVLALPFYLYIFYRSAKVELIEPREAFGWSLLFALTAASAIIFSIVFSGGRSVADGICTSLLLHGFNGDICSGAIEWLGFDSKYGIEKVFDNFPAYIFNFPFLFALSIAPVFLLGPKNRSMTAVFIVGFISFLPLYYVAIDWGRWISIYIFFVFVSILAESVLCEIKLKPVNPWLLIIYLTTWSIPHCCSSRPGFGLISKIFKQITLIKL